MRFTETAIPGAFIVEPELQEDERGFFARVFFADEFKRRGLETDFPQSSVSFNRSRGTLRGLHYQAEPHAEVKLVRCTMGAIYDVIVDLRTNSPTQHCCYGIDLSAENRRMLYIPKGLAHGYLTMMPATEVLYQISTPYRKDAARGVRWNDPKLGIHWPGAVKVISSRDSALPLLEGA